MSAAAASPLPPPPPESKSSATKPEKKNRSYKKLLEDSGKQEYCSANVTSTPDTSGGRSLIRSWLEGKLDDDHHPVTGEGEASSISPTAPAVSPTPISSLAPILMLQLDDGSILSNSINPMEIVADATSNRIAAVYDPFINGWYLLPMEVYHVVFGTNIYRQPPPLPPPPPVDENDNKNKFQTSAIKPKTILIGEIEVPVILPPTTTIAKGYEDEQEINNANEAVKEETRKGKKKKNNNKKKKNKGKKK